MAIDLSYERIREALENKAGHQNTPEAEIPSYLLGQSVFHLTAALDLIQRYARSQSWDDVDEITKEARSLFGLIFDPSAEAITDPVEAAALRQMLEAGPQPGDRVWRADGSFYQVPDPQGASAQSTESGPQDHPAQRPPQTPIPAPAAASCDGPVSRDPDTPPESGPEQTPA